MAATTLQPTVHYENLPALDSDPQTSSPQPHSPYWIGRGLRRRTIIVEGAQPPEPSRPHASASNSPFPPSESTITATSAEGPPPKKRRWRPLLLRPWVMISNVVVLLVMAIILEIILWINHNDYGWETPSFYKNFPQIHILWTAAPGIITLNILSQWSGVDRYIKILQPYVDMSRHGAPAEKSVLLNYEGQSKLTVWVKMIENKHFTVFLTNTLALLTLIVPSLCSSYLYLQQPPPSFAQPLSNITVNQELGLYKSTPFQFTDAAAGFLKASSLYSVSPPSFIRFLPAAAWTSTQVSISGMYADGFVRALTVCIKSMVTCEVVDSPLYDAASAFVTGSSANCSFGAPFVPSAIEEVSFGMSTATCSGFKAPNITEYSPVAFWVIGGGVGNSPVATVCKPSLLVQRATGYLNTTTSALILVADQQPFVQGDQNGVDLSSAPFNGSAFNGLFFSNVTDVIAQAKLNTTQLNFGEAIATLVSNSNSTASRAEILQNVTANAYAHYLGVVTPSLYYQSVQNETTVGSLYLTAQRLFISEPITHTLFAIFIIMAVMGAVVTILHHRAAKNLFLTYEPGTVAAAIALGGLSDIAHILDGKDTLDDMRAMLADLQFAIDPNTNRLRVEESEQGYRDIPSYQMVPKSPRRYRLNNMDVGTSPGVSPNPSVNYSDHSWSSRYALVRREDDDGV